MILKFAVVLIPMTLVSSLMGDVTADPGVTGYFAQLGVGAILAAPAYYFWFKAEQTKTDLVNKLLDAERAATVRERELSTEMVPIIRDGALALREVKDSMGSLVHEARDVAETNRRDQQTRRLELVIDKLGKSLEEGKGED